jgi:CheY-like chemotaxis protein
VLDTGIGIPGDQLRYIFDEFYQVGVPTNSSRAGYGLGLSIVHRLVALLDGKLDVLSQVGKGSQFGLTLPAGHGTVRRAPRAAEPALRVPQAQVRVLLVEDDASVRDATRMLLKSDGYHVTAVNSLAEALAHAAKDARLDLLVTDYHLRNGETGMQVIAALREALKVPLRAILITGDTSAAVHELRMDPHLRLASKPIKAEELLGMLGALLNT